MNTRLDRYVPGGTAKLNLVVDTGLLAGALWLARGAGLGAFDQRFAGMLGLAFSIWFVATAVFRLYAPLTPRRLLDSMLLGMIAALTPTLGLLAIHWLAADPVPFSAELFYLALFVGNQLNHHVLGRALDSKLAPQVDQVLILGTGELGRSTCERMLCDSRRRVLGFLHFAGEPDAVPFSSVPVLGTSETVVALLSAHPVDEVYIAGHIKYQAQEMQQVVRACELVGMPFAVPLHSLHFDRATLISESTRRDGYLHYQNTVAKPVQHAIKRLLDILASAAALAVLSPLLVLVILAIKIESRGPVLFKQLRVGLHGAQFHMLKFRSMVLDAEARLAELRALNELSGPVFKISHDPRITRVGRFIRKYSID